MVETLFQLILHAAERDPHWQAVVCGAASLTYGSLRDSSLRLAGVLAAAGFVKGDRVAIFMDKCVEMAVAVYGVLAAGGCYVPIDPRLPAARIHTVLRDAGVRFLITQPSKRKRGLPWVEESQGLRAIIGWEEAVEGVNEVISWNQILGESQANGGERVGLDSVGIESHDPAYILYTSGSTGVPKGIYHTHSSALAFACWGAEICSMRTTDRVGNHAPLHFDLSTFDFFATACAGATLVLIPDEYTKLSASYSALLEKEKISIWYTVPFALAQLLDRGQLGGGHHESLRWILFAGEPLAVKHLKALRVQLPGTRLGNWYGPTETNVCTAFMIPPGSTGEEWEGGIPIGSACCGDGAKVMDEAGREVPVGEPGELWVCGPTVMQGYWNRDDLNQRCFVSGEAMGMPQLRFYRTGDLVRDKGQGVLEFLGRLDRQVKVRGYRVELEEVERALNLVEEVEESVVLARESDGAGFELIAILVLKESASLLPRHLMTELGKVLPPYAIPSQYFCLTTFPRTSTGKVDRRSVAQMEESWVMFGVENQMAMGIGKTTKHFP